MKLGLVIQLLLLIAVGADSPDGDQSETAAANHFFSGLSPSQNFGYSNNDAKECSKSITKPLTCNYKGIGKSKDCPKNSCSFIPSSGSYYGREYKIVAQYAKPYNVEVCRKPGSTCNCMAIGCLCWVGWNRNMCTTHWKSVDDWFYVYPNYHYNYNDDKKRTFGVHNGGYNAWMTSSYNYGYFRLLKLSVRIPNGCKCKTSIVTKGNGTPGPPPRPPRPPIRPRPPTRPRPPKPPTRPTKRRPKKPITITLTKKPTVLTTV